MLLYSMQQFTVQRNYNANEYLTPEYTHSCFANNISESSQNLMPFSTMSTIPGISDHDAIVIDSDIKPAYVKKKPHSIFIFSKADWAKMCENKIKFTIEFQCNSQGKLGHT